MWKSQISDEDIQNSPEDFDNMETKLDKSSTHKMTNELEKMDVGSSTTTKYQKLKEWMSFENECQKKNFLQTCCVYFNFVLLGWTYGQLGTAFPDFQLILNTNVKQTSLLFTMNSVGYMIGSLAVGFFYDRVSHLKLLGTVSVLNGVTSIVLPWCKGFGLFLFVRLLDGFLCGGRDGGGNTKVASCWGTEGRQYMQALHFTYAFGGIISPLVTNLFLAPRLNIPPSDNATYGNFTISTETNNVSANYSDFKTGDGDVVYGKTNVHVAFIITGLLTALSGFLYFVLYRQNFETVPPYSKSDSLQKSNKLNSVTFLYSRAKLTRVEKCIFIVILGISVMSCSTVECKYQSFIMPFVLMQMKWSKSQGAFLISLLWAFYGIGRFTGIFISKFILPKVLLVSFMSMLVFASCVLCIGSYFKIDAVVWVMVPIAGLSISIIFPTFIVWTQENALKINGKMGGYFLFVGALGFFIDPLYIGVLMENVSPMYFNYLNIAEGSFAVCMVLLLLFWIGKLRKPNMRHKI